MVWFTQSLVDQQPGYVVLPFRLIKKSYPIQVRFASSKP